MGKTQFNFYLRHLLLMHQSDAHHYRKLGGGFYSIEKLFRMQKACGTDRIGANPLREGLFAPSSADVNWKQSGNNASVPRRLKSIIGTANKLRYNSDE